METTAQQPQRNSVLYKIVQALQHVERAWDTDATGFGRDRTGTSMRLSGRPDTWVDIEWHDDTHTVFLAFKVSDHVMHLNVFWLCS